MAPIGLFRRTPRGVTLLEAVMSLAVLSIGVAGTLQLQAYGMTADGAARAQTQATQVARELLVSLEQLPPEDPRIAPHFSGGTNPPTEFGHLVLPSGELATTDFAEYDDSLDLAGVTTDAEYIGRAVTDPTDVTLVRFKRRWTVWEPAGPVVDVGSKFIAVSVIWHERGLPGLREVVLYGSVINAAAVTSYANLAR